MAYRRCWLASAMAIVLPGAALAQVQIPVQPAGLFSPPAATGDAAQPPAAGARETAGSSLGQAAAPAVEDVNGDHATGLARTSRPRSTPRATRSGKDLLATTGSIADALRSLPSVEVDLQGNLSLRGDPSVTILVDGKPAPAFEGAGRADALQQLPADQIERVEVMTNPSAALNPEGSGGVINLITKKSRGGGLTGSAYSTVSTAGLKRAGVNFGYNSSTLAVTASLSGNYQPNKGHTTDRA